MSTSTVSITPNPATAARRRPVEKKSTGIDLLNNNDAVLASPAPPTATTGNLTKPANGDAGVYLSRSVRAETTSNRDPVVGQVKKPLPNRAANSGRKAHRPKWLTVVRILTKNLLLLLAVLGLVQWVRKQYVKNEVVLTKDGVSVLSAEWEGKFADMESFVKKTTKMIQVQVDVVDRKIDKQISSLKDEFIAKEGEFNKKLSELREDLERELGEKSQNLFTKEEFDAFFEEYSKARAEQKGDGVSLDEVRAYAREIVEKELEKHAADGLGRVDYALASGGAMVLSHSEPVVGRWNLRSSDGAAKMLTPSFGEPAQCFPLKGGNGFVKIRLRTAIFPEAITLEHVAKSVAYDLSSAPKDCRVYGGSQGQERDEMVLLTEFTYDLEKTSAQTFNVLDSVVSKVDTVRFEFTSNYGGPHTCIYRLRVHGHE